VKIAHPRKTRILGLIGFGDMEMTVTLLSDGTVFTRLSLADGCGGGNFGFKAPTSSIFE
jgi:hypothetical protein